MAIVGNVGSNRHMHFTTKGDTVNLGALLEEANKQYSTTILISERTHSQLSGGFITREIDRVKIVGHNRPAGIYELLGLNERQ